MAGEFELNGKVAIVTGASRGLGQYFSRALARAGADVVITSRTIESLAQTRSEIRGHGPSGAAVHAGYPQDGDHRSHG